MPDVVKLPGARAARAADTAVCERVFWGDFTSPLLVLTDLGPTAPDKPRASTLSLPLPEAGPTLRPWNTTLDWPGVLPTPTARLTGAPPPSLGTTWKHIRTQQGAKFCEEKSSQVSRPRKPLECSPGLLIPLGFFEANAMHWR